MVQLAQQSQHPVKSLNKLLQSLKWHAKQHANALGSKTILKAVFKGALKMPSNSLLNTSNGCSIYKKPFNLPEGEACLKGLCRPQV